MCSKYFTDGPIVSPVFLTFEQYSRRIGSSFQVVHLPTVKPGPVVKAGERTQREWSRLGSLPKKELKDKVKSWEEVS